MSKYIQWIVCLSVLWPATLNAQIVDEVKYYHVDLPGNLVLANNASHGYLVPQAVLTPFSISEQFEGVTDYNGDYPVVDFINSFNRTCQMQGAYWDTDVTINNYSIPPGAGATVRFWKAAVLLSSVNPTSWGLYFGRVPFPVTEFGYIDIIFSRRNLAFGASIPASGTTFCRANNDPRTITFTQSNILNETQWSNVTFTGPGVSGNTWSLDNAQTGTNVITMSEQFDNGVLTRTRTFIVQDQESLPNTDNESFCQNSGNPVLDIGNADRITVVPNTGVPANFLNFNTITGDYTINTQVAPGIYQLYAHNDPENNTECENRKIFFVEIQAQPTVNAGPNNTLCDNYAPFNLLGSPSGGTFTGVGVVGSTFDPSLSGTGSFTLTYNYTNSNGCSASDTRVITVNPGPVLNLGADIQVCNGTGLVPLTATPSGGTWSGAGIVGNNFNSNISPGTYVIQYFLIQGSCVASATKEVTVNPAPVIDLTVVPATICRNAGITTLNAIPSGGTWSGPGIIPPNQINPLLLASGSENPHVYSFTNGNGCSASATTSIVGVDTANFSIGANRLFCINGSPYDLDSDIPSRFYSGGTWTGPGIVGNIFNPLSAGLGIHELTYTFTATSGCISRIKKLATVNPLPTVNAGADLDLCINEGNIVLTGIPSGGTWSGSGVSFDGSNYMFDVSAVGVYTAVYSYSDGLCVNTDQITIRVNDVSAVDAGVNFTTCINSPDFVISGGFPGGGTWSGTGVSGGRFFPAVAGLGNTDITYTYTNGDGCISTDTRIASVVNLPIVNAGSDITLCENSGSYSLIGDVNIQGGTFSGSGVNGLNFNPASAGIGVHVINYNFSSGAGCSNSDSRLITVVGPAAITLPPNDMVCITDPPFPLTGANIAGGTWSGSGVNAGIFNPASAGTGTKVITYSAVDGNGCATSNSYEIQVNGLPNVNAGTDIFVCDGTSILSLDGTASPSGGTWSGAFITGNNFDVSSSGLGSFTVSYSFTNSNGCSAIDTKEIIVNSGSTVNAGTDIETCLSTNVIDLSINAVPFGGTFAGVGVSGSTFDPSTGIGNYNITYTVTNGFGCSGTDNLIVTVRPDPLVNAGTNTAVCLNADSLVLANAASPSGGVFSGQGVDNGFFFPGIAGTGNNTVTYNYTDNKGCVASDQRDIQVLSLPNVNAGSNAFICSNHPLIDLDLNASPNNGLWTGPGISNGIFDPSALGSGQYQLNYTVIDNNGCSGSDTRIVTIFDPLSVNAGNDIVLCQNSGFYSLDSGASVTGGIWSGTGISNGLFDSDRAIGSYNANYTIQNAYGCSASDAKVVTIISAEMVTIGSDVTVCSTAPTLNLNASLGGGAWSGSGVTGNVFNPALSGIGDHDIFYTVIDGNGCRITVSKTIEVEAPPSLNAGPNIITCVSNNPIDLDLNAGGNFSGNWSGTGVTGSFFDPSISGVGNFTVTGTVDNGNGCISSDNVSINVRNDIAVNAGADLTVCSNDNPVSLVLESSVIGGSWAGPGVTGNFFDPDVSGTGNFNLVLSYTDVYGCSASDQKLISVNASPVINVGNTIIACKTQDSIDLNGNAFPSGGLWTGPGVNNSVFKPGLMATGSYTLNYSFTSLNGCKSEKDKIIEVISSPVINVGLSSVTCQTGSPIDLNAGLNSPGVWTGIGVYSNLFIPDSVTIGSYTLNYEFNAGNGCISYSTKDIIVTGSPDLQIGSNISSCVNGATIDLNSEANLAGGTWSGTGISNNQFNPSSAGVGSHQINYKYISPLGCELNANKLVQVFNIPSVSAGADITACNTQDSIVLNINVSPSGGTWSGVGISNDVVFPAQLGNGTYNYSYTVASPQGCINTDSKEIEIESPQAVSAGPNLTVCLSSSEINLESEVSIPGGFWLGSSVVNDFFLPSLFGVGTNPLEYVIDDNNGCVSRDFKTIIVRADPVITLNDSLALCENSSLIDLSQFASPAGGVWSGIGLNGSNFNASNAGVGSFINRYRITDNFGCSVDENIIIEVNPAPMVSAGSDLEICNTLDSVNLSLAAFPSGGIFSGPGVSGPIFDPVFVGNGIYTIQYRYTDSLNCSNTDIREIEVVNPPQIDAGTNVVLCQNSQAFDLDLDVSILGGTWSGSSALNGSFFDPAISGSGTFVLQYRYNDGLGCLSSDQRTIIVRSIPTVDVGDSLQLCSNSQTVNLAVLPDKQGGIWSGPGVNSNSFNPAISGAGIHVLNYVYTDAFGCVATDNISMYVDPSPIVNSGSDISICNTATPLNLASSASPAGGIFSGAGVTGNTFDASVVVNGDYNISYTFTDGNGCSASDVREITVENPPNISAGATEVICLSSSQIDLDVDVSILGGTWSGSSALNGSFFDPSVSGVGQFILTYALDYGSGCLSTDQKTIVVRADPTVSVGDSLRLCGNAGLINLNTLPNKSGGIWSGPGVNSNSFNPVLSGSGIHVLNYLYTDAFGCVATEDISIYVDPAPLVNSGSDITICNTAPLVNLALAATPLGGVFSGPGVLGNSFNPSAVSNGDYDITYSYTDGNGCSASDVREITVGNPPSISAGATEVICLSSGQIDLDLDVSILGGTWSGSSALNGSFFDPSVSGTGNFVLNYSYNFGAGCISSSTKTVVVRNDPTVSVGDSLRLCRNDGLINLNTLPNRSGGIWSGPGVNGTSFNPVLSGTGIHVLNYMYTDAFGCVATDDISMYVDPAPLVNSGSDITICNTAPLVNLALAATPLGGVFSGPGVLGSSFDPSAVSNGDYDITYSYTDGNGCSASDVREITVGNPPSISAGANEVLCVSGNQLDLDLDVSILGGTWSGSSALNGSFFDPSISGVGNFSVQYTYNFGNGCIATDTRLIIVRNNPTVSVGDSTVLCLNSNTINLSTLPDKQGGIWSGPGVNGSSFNPLSAGTGLHVLNYTYTDGFGCDVSASHIMRVNGLPNINAGPNLAYCFDTAAIGLSNFSSPSGGSYFGSGINQDSFFIHLAGVGRHIITYSYTDGNGCSNSDDLEIEVLPLPSVDAGSDFVICVNASPVVLNGNNPSPSGGVWIGTGVLANVFDPGNAGIGSYPLIYRYTAGNSCRNADTILVTVVPEPILSFTSQFQFCLADLPLNLSDSVNIFGGSFSGSGMTGDVFNPLDAGIGTHIITYSVNINGCVLQAFSAFIVTGPTAITIGTDVAVCVTGSTIDLTNTTSILGGSFTGNGVNGTIFDPSLANIGANLITYTYVNGAGCISQSTRIITVQLPISVNAGADLSLCSTVGSFDLSSYGSPAGGTYLGNFIVSNVFDASAAGIGTHQLVYEYPNGNGCLSYDSLIITITQSPISNVGIDTIVCVNSDELTLNFNPQLLGGTWSGTGVVNNQFFASLAGEGIHVLTYTNTSLPCDVVATREITVVGLPGIATGLFDEISGCKNDLVELRASISVEDRLNNVVVQWRKESAILPFISGEKIDYVINAQEKIFYQSVDQFGCSSGQTDFIQIYTNDPELDFAVSDLTPKNGDPVQFLTFNEVNVDGYEWYFGDGEFSYTAAPWHYYYDSGSYTVTLTAISQNNCSTEIKKDNLVTVGLEEGRENGSILSDPLKSNLGYQSYKGEILILDLYPNPVINDLIMNVVVEKTESYVLELISVQGISYMHQELRLNHGYNTKKLSLKGVSAGAYYMRITGTDRTITYKIIKL